LRWTSVIARRAKFDTLLYKSLAASYIPSSKQRSPIWKIKQENYHSLFRTGPTTPQNKVWVWRPQPSKQAIPIVFNFFLSEHPPVTEMFCTHTQCKHFYLSILDSLFFPPPAVLPCNLSTKLGTTVSCRYWNHTLQMPVSTDRITQCHNPNEDNVDTDCWKP
jgi:hypothetical protein